MQSSACRRVVFFLHIELRGATFAGEWLQVPMKRCAAILVKGEWVIINDPTIGDIYRLRQRGAIIMRLVVHRYGNEIHSDWTTESGRVVTSRIDFLPRTCTCTCACKDKS